MPSGQRWRDVWDGKVYRGGQPVTVPAATHQLPLFVRVGAKIDLGDLNQEWKESLEIAEKKPDLKKLDADLRRKSC